MSAEIIDGKAFSKTMLARTQEQVEYLKSHYGLTPGLAVIIVGEDPASQVYVRNKAKQTQEAGMQSFVHRLDYDTSQEDLLALIKELNEDRSVHGILCQLPLPDHIAETLVINAIDPAKDVDGFHTINVGLLNTGQKAMIPCTPLGCLLLLKHQLGDLAGLNAVVVGRSNIVGKPMASLLIGQSCTVTVAHSKTRNIEDICRRADIVVAAVGRPRMIKKNWIKSGATIIDVGINRLPAPEKGEDKTKLVGDVDFQSVAEVAGAITPVPGGVGPMTIACLLANTITACCRANQLPDPEGLSA